MAVAATRVGNVADTSGVRGVRRVLVLGLLTSTLGMLALPPVIGLFVLAGWVA